MISFSRGATLVAIFLLAVFGAGCGRSPVATPADPTSARKVLERGLTAWQKGAPPATLNSGSDPIVFADFNWDRGSKLLEFSLDSIDEPFGAERRIRARLTLQQNAKTVVVTVPYLVGTMAPKTIRREDE